MKFFPKITRAQDPRLAILQMIHAGYDVALPAEQINGVLPRPGRSVKEHVEGLAKAARAVGCEVGALGVSAEYILAAPHPTIVFIRLIPEDPPRPVIVWNKAGFLYQILDPRAGRRWVTAVNLLQELYLDPVAWSKETCEQAVQHPSQLAFLRQRLTTLKITPETQERVLAAAAQSLPALSQLNGAVRLVEEMVADGVQRGVQAEQWLTDFLAEQDALTTIPATHHLVQAEGDQYRFQGVLAIPILGCAAPAIGGEAATPPKGNPQQKANPQQKGRGQRGPQGNMLSGGVVPRIRQYLQEEGVLHPAVVLSAIVVAALGVSLEAVVLRGLMEIGLHLETPELRTTAIVLVLLFIFLNFVMSWGLQDQAKRFGRRFDLRLRQAVFAFVPRLSDQYFQKLSPADIVDRLYNVQSVPTLTYSAYTFLSQAVRVVFITLGILWIDWPLAIVNYLFIYGGSVIFANGMRNVFLAAYRAQTLNGRLSVLYVDGVRGRPSIWSHGAEQAVRYEYEQGLTEFGQASLMQQKIFLAISAIIQIPVIISPVLQLLLYTYRGGSAVNLFLLFYWIMELNQLVGNVIGDSQAVTNNIARASRFSDILETPTEEASLPDASDTVDESLPYIKMANVSVQMGRQTILHDIDVEIGKGEHVAIVGTSGAGKSTLVSLLLGRHYASQGQLFVDGKLLDYEHLCQLRQRTAWVDPNMQLWDESLLHNLQYGTHQSELSDLLHISIEQADLLSVLERMPHGLASPLGEAGRLVSGGEGQRVRFGRGLHRASAELVILDEAFRGIDRRQRDTLLKRARAYWQDKTLICVTHDVSHTLDFERVLVMEQGRIIEDAHPATLMAQPNSRYRALFEEEEQVRVRLWENESWRHLYLASGELTERTTRAPLNTND